MAIAAAAVFAVIAAAASVLGMLAYKAEHKAEMARGVAEQERATAVQEREKFEQQRDHALTTQSRLLADLANKSIEKGDLGTALLLALEGVPDRSSGTLRPRVAEAVAALMLARLNLQETKVLADPDSYLSGALFSPD